MKRKPSNPAKRLKIISAVLWALSALGVVGILYLIQQCIEVWPQGGMGPAAAVLMALFYGIPAVAVTVLLGAFAAATGVRAKTISPQAIVTEAQPAETPRSAAPNPRPQKDTGRTLRKVGLWIAGPGGLAVVIITFAVSYATGEQWQWALFSGLFRALKVILAGGVIYLIGALMSRSSPRASIAS